MNGSDDEIRTQPVDTVTIELSREQADATLRILGWEVDHEREIRAHFGNENNLTDEDLDDLTAVCRQIAEKLGQ